MADLKATCADSRSGLVTAIIRFHDFFTNDFDEDPTWTAVSLLIVTIAEPALYLIAACLLAMRPLLKWSLERVPLEAFRRGSVSGQLSDNNPYAMQKTTFNFPSERVNQTEDPVILDGHRAVLGLESV